MNALAVGHGDALRALRYHVRRCVAFADVVTVELGGPWAGSLTTDARRRAFSLAYYEADMERRRIDAEKLRMEREAAP